MSHCSSKLGNLVLRQQSLLDASASKNSLLKNKIIILIIIFVVRDSMNFVILVDVIFVENNIMRDGRIVNDVKHEERLLVISNLLIPIKVVGRVNGVENRKPLFDNEIWKLSLKNEVDEIGCDRIDMRFHLIKPQIVVELMRKSLYRFHF